MFLYIIGCLLTQNVKDVVNNLNQNNMLRKLIEKWSCKHKWEIHSTTNIHDTDIPDMPTKIRQTLICQHCGKIKQINL